MSFNTGSNHFELLSTNNKKLLDQWKMHSGVKKDYDTQSKTYVYKVVGESPVIQMYFPKNKAQKLYLTYPLLVLQIYFPIKGNVLFNIGITSSNNQRKRITLSSNQKCNQNSLLFTVLPFAIENFDKWTNVLVDVEEIISVVWKDIKLKRIDFLSLSGVFTLKRMFLISRDLLQNREGIFVINYDQLPKQMSQPRTIMLQHYQYISSAYSSMAESPQYQSSETSEISRNNSRMTSNRSHFSITSSKKTQSNSSRSSLRSTLTIMSSSASETENQVLQDPNIENIYPSKLNSSENHTRSFDFNLPWLTFSEEILPKMQQLNSNKETAEKDKELGS